MSESKLAAYAIPALHVSLCLLTLVGIVLAAFAVEARKDFVSWLRSAVAERQM
jgi:hypothetical protein